MAHASLSLSLCLRRFVIESGLGYLVVIGCLGTSVKSPTIGDSKKKGAARPPGYSTLDFPRYSTLVVCLQHALQRRFISRSLTFPFQLFVQNSEFFRLRHNPVTPIRILLLTKYIDHSFIEYPVLTDLQKSSFLLAETESIERERELK